MSRLVVKISLTIQKSNPFYGHSDGNKRSSFRFKKVKFGHFARVHKVGVLLRNLFYFEVERKDVFFILFLVPEDIILWRKFSFNLKFKFTKRNRIWLVYGKSLKKTPRINLTKM